MRISIAGCWILALSVPVLVGCATTRYRTAVPEPIIREEAARVPGALWRESLGTDAIVSMDLIGEARLLLRLRPDEAAQGDEYTRMLDRESGQLLWEYRPGEDGEHHERALLMSETLLLSVMNEEAVRLVAIDIDNGNQLWSRAARRSAVAYPVVPNESIIVVTGRNDGVELEGVDVGDGAGRWEITYPTDGEGMPPAPLVLPDTSWVFYDGVVAISSATGATRWQRPDIRLDPDSPPPALQGDMLLVLDSSNDLHALNPDDGQTVWTIDQDPDVAYTNLFPVGGRLYLRGESMQADGQSGYVVDAIDIPAGTAAWRHEHPVPTVSNIVDHAGSTFLATSRTLVAVERSSGRTRFERDVTNTSRDFPARLRIVDGMVVFIGEMIVAAYDVETGEERYVAGMNPVSDAMSLSALEDDIGYFKDFEPDRDTVWGSISRHAQGRSAHYQNRARHYWKLANEYDPETGTTGASSSLDVRLARWKAQSSWSHAEAQAQIAVHASMMQMADDLSAAIKSAAAQRRYQRALLRRQGLLNVYGGAESSRHVYRPSEYEHPRNAPFVGVTVVDLATGKREQTLLSPKYRSFGLWTLIDWEKRIAYYQGIGLDPDRYEYGESQFYSELYKTFLIARPVKLP